MHHSYRCRTPGCCLCVHRKHHGLTFADQYYWLQITVNNVEIRIDHCSQQLNQRFFCLALRLHHLEYRCAFTCFSVSVFLYFSVSVSQFSCTLCLSVPVSQCVCVSACPYLSASVSHCVCVTLCLCLTVPILPRPMFSHLCWLRKRHYSGGPRVERSGRRRWLAW